MIMRSCLSPYPIVSDDLVQDRIETMYFVDTTGNGFEIEFVNTYILTERQLEKFRESPVNLVFFERISRK